MKVHSKPLADKRRDLQLRCALQRQEVAHLGGNIEARLVTADKVLGIAASIAQKPVIVIAAIAGALILGPWRTMRWVSQGALLYGAAKKVQQLLTK